MFRGINEVNIDTKGRISVPTRYRDRLQVISSGQLVVTIDTEATCLLLYPLPEWEIIEEKINTLPSFKPAARRIQRLLIGHATELMADKNGRILLPELLREYAQLSQKAIFLGQSNKFEIWDKQMWTDGRQEWLKKASDQTILPSEIQDLSL